MSDKLQLTKKLLEEQPSVKEMLELEPVKARWVEIYQGTTGKKDGAMRFEAEVINFMQLFQNNAKLAECDRFSIYNSFVELCLSGLSLRDGLSCIIPRKKKAQFQVMAKGRLEQMLDLPNVIQVQEPQLVYEEDTFEFSRGESVKILKHVSKKHRTSDKIEYVYMHITYTHGKECFIMEREEVLRIRDQYSESYKYYVSQLDNPFNKGKRKWGDDLQVSGNSGPYFMETPMWVSNEGQAFKKTLIKRVWGSQKKLPKQKVLDEILEARGAYDVELDGSKEDQAIVNAAEMSESDMKSAFLSDDNGEDDPYTDYEELATDPEPENQPEKPKAKRATKAKEATAPAPDPAPLQPNINFENPPVSDDMDPNTSF